MKEFEIIDHYFKKLSQNTSDATLELSIGDDCAVIDSAKLNQAKLLVTTDTLIEGTHFLSNQPPHSIGYKALAVNLSDIAAMGGIPKWVLLNLSLPKVDPLWLAEFSQGIAQLINQYNLTLIGGDTTHAINNGPLSITVTVLGINHQNNLTRSNAKLGDGIFITGHLGEPNYILDKLLAGEQVSDNNKYYYPQPRVETAKFISQYANSAIDLSDGLLADLGHILKQSNKAAVLDFNTLPISNIVLNNKSLIQAEKYNKYILTGGDEYEIIFTAPIEHRKILEDYSETKITYIGKIESVDILDNKKNINNIVIIGFDGDLVSCGWEHFGV